MSKYATPATHRALNYLKSLHRQSWVIILALVFLAPLGIYLMIRYAKWGRPRKWITGTGFALLFILFSIGVYNAPPTLTLSNVAKADARISTDNATYWLRGRVSSFHDTTITINNKLANIANDQTFAVEVPLREGDNVIEVKATSDRGNDIAHLRIHRTTTAEFFERKRLAAEAEAKKKQATATEVAAKATADAAKAADEANKIKLAQQPTPTGDLYAVTSIVDGDTIKVSIDGKNMTIRFIGIDTPETQDPRKPVQCYGKEASSRMQHYAQSKKVRLAVDSTQGDKDKYGRLLRYVFLEDGRNIAYEMIREGYGKEYTYSSAYRYQSQFKEAQRLASQEKLGLWATNTCNGDTSQTASTPQPTTTAQPAPVAAPAPTPTPTTSSGCDPNYSPCVPLVSYDLDCADIGFKVTVIGVDVHRFDRDGNGTGCESY